MEAWKRHDLNRKKPERLCVRLTKEEKESLQNKAKELNLTLSELFLTVLN